MNQSERLQQALADPDGFDLLAACDAASGTLAHCADWFTAGAIREAAALNADAGNIIGLAVRLSRSKDGPPAELRLPDADTLRTLTRLPADAASHHDQVARWIELNLAEAPLTDRLAAIRTLRLLEPNNAAWKRNHEEIEAAVVRLWADETDQCIAAGDPEAIARLNEQIVAMGFLGRPGQQLLHTLNLARTEQRALLAEQDLAPLGTRLHVAWAAMDVPLARRIQTAWRKQAALAAGDHEQDTRAVFRWIEREDRREAHERSIQDRLDDLVRALDELKPVHAIERRYAALRNDQALIPPAVESRVTHYITEERRKRTRRFVVVLASIITIASVLTGVLLVSHYTTRRQRMIEDLSTCIRQNLEADRLREARDCWKQAIEAQVEDAPLIAAHAAGIARAAQTLEDWRDQADLDIERATSLLEPDDATLLRIEEAVGLLRGAEQVARTELIASLHEQLRRAATLRSDRLAEARDGRMREFAAIESLLAEDQPPYADQAGWEARAETIQRANRMLLQLRERPAAEEPDLRQRADGLQSRIQYHATLTSERVAGLQEADRLMSELLHIPSSECSWANTWDDLLGSHAELLMHDGRRNWLEGRNRAQAACAAENWRRVVLPKLRLYGLLGHTGAAPDPRAARTTLKSHLDLFVGDQSPYREVATRLIALAERSEQRHLGDLLRRRIEATGLLELYVADTADGYRYLRPFEDGLRRIDSRQELSNDPRMLKQLTASEEHDLYSFPKPAAIAVALQEGLDACDAEGIPPAEAVCDLLQAVQECPERDELLQLAVHQALWSLIVELELPLPAQARLDAATWLESVGSNARGTLRGDWALRGPTANSPVQALTRRAARRETAASPRHHKIRSLNVADLRSEETLAMAAARVIQGLLIPEPDDPGDSMRVHLLEAEVRHPEVLVRRGGGWQFIQFDDRLAHNDLVDAPRGIRDLPVIIFGAP